METHLACIDLWKKVTSQRGNRNSDNAISTMKKVTVSLRFDIVHSMM